MKAFAHRIFVAAVVIGAIVLTAYVFRWILLLLAGILLAILFRTAADWLSRHTKLSVRWAIAIVLIGVAVLVVGIFWEFGSRIAGQADQLMSTLSQALGSLQQSAQRYPNLHRIVSGSKLDLAQPTETLIRGAIKVAAAVVLVAFVGAYVCIDPDTYIRGLLRFSSEERRPEIRMLLDDSVSALKAWISGQLIAMAVVGTITAIGLLVLGLPMAVPLAVIATLFTFVPYIGAISSAIPALLIAFSVSTHAALYVAIVFLIAHGAEGYVVVPMVQHRLVYLPPALILANLFFMNLVVGIVGVAMGTPFLVIEMVIVERLYFHERWSDKPKAA